MHVFNESNVFILFHFFMGVLWGALVFLRGAGAPASAAHANKPVFSVSVLQR